MYINGMDMYGLTTVHKIKNILELDDISVLLMDLKLPALTSGGGPITPVLVLRLLSIWVVLHKMQELTLQFLVVILHLQHHQMY